MKTGTSVQTPEAYIEQWLQSVANDEYTMSQRKLSSLKKKEIDIEKLVEKAKSYKLHLLLLKDDTGEELIAASKDDFVVLC